MEGLEKGALIALWVKDLGLFERVSLQLKQYYQMPKLRKRATKRYVFVFVLCFHVARCLPFFFVTTHNIEKNKQKIIFDIIAFNVIIDSK